MPLMPHIQDIEQLLKDDSRSGSPFSISLEVAFRSVRNDLLHVCGVKAGRLLSLSHPKYSKITMLGASTRPSWSTNQLCSWMLRSHIKAGLPCEWPIRASLCSKLWFWVVNSSQQTHACRTLRSLPIILFCWTMLKALVWPLRPLKLSKNRTKEVNQTSRDSSPVSPLHGAVVQLTVHKRGPCSEHLQGH